MMKGSACWDEGCTKYTLRYSELVGPWLRGRCEPEDTVQDGFIIFNVLRERFPSKGQRELMALYKQALRWHVLKLVNATVREAGHLVEYAHYRAARRCQAPAPGFDGLGEPPPALSALLVELGIDYRKPRGPRRRRFPKAAYANRAAMGKYLAERAGISAVGDELVVLLERWLGRRVQHAVLPSA